MLTAIASGLRALRARVRYRLAGRIVIGSAEIPCPGWLATTKISLDVTKREDFARHWRPNSREAFLAEHVWEHLTGDEARRAAANCFEFLRPGGRLRLAVPDGLHPDPAYIESVRPGGTGAGADDHKVLYDVREMTAMLEAGGFRVEPLEYWDETGTFRSRDWSSDDGHVRRSARHDPRNRERPLAYTSLIVDAVKPSCA